MSTPSSPATRWVSDLAEELGRLRPFGMGNPGVSVLVPAARVSDVQPMSEGRHVRFTVTSGGVRSRAVGFRHRRRDGAVLRERGGAATT